MGLADDTMKNTDKSDQETVTSIKHTNLLSLAIIIASLFVLTVYFVLNMN